MVRGKKEFLWYAVDVAGWRSFLLWFDLVFLGAGVKYSLAGISIKS
jgi:hypothetical protein